MDVQYGKKLSLECKIENSTIRTLYWKLNERNIYGYTKAEDGTYVVDDTLKGNDRWDERI